LLALTLWLVAIGSAAGTVVDAGFTRENLDNGYDDWRSEYLSAEWKPGPRRAVYGVLRKTERFSLDDTDLTAGIYHPLTADAVLFAEAAVSSTHDVLPQWTLLAQTEMAFAHGIGVHIGARHAEYVSARVNDGRITLERYVGNYRLAYAATASRLAGGETGWTHAVQAARYYANTSRVGFVLATGTEVESLGPAGVAVTDIESVALIGRHWLRGNWHVSYEAGHYKQGDLYTRNLVGLGLGYRF
jgi:YaiO family outer membrane protein